MILTTKNLVHYLIARGLVTPDSAVDGDLLITDSSHRNRSFRVLRKNHPSYFVKQIRTWDPQSIAAWKCEAQCYCSTRSDPDFSSFATLVPQYFDHDPQRYALTIELFSEAENLSIYHRRLKTCPALVGKELGSALSLYHRNSAIRLKDVTERVPWILSLHETSADLFSSLSGANAQLIRIVQEDKEFCQALDAARERWKPAALIHGDIKWDNCILTKGDSGLKLIDWELADYGDPCWDAGAVLQTYLSYWIFSMQPANGAAAAQLVESAQQPIESMQPALQAFWKTYTDNMDATRDTVREWLDRSVVYAAARLIQTAFEMMHTFPQITPHGAYLLQTSLNILKRPGDAARELLGL